MRHRHRWRGSRPRGLLCFPKDRGVYWGSPSVGHLPSYTPWTGVSANWWILKPYSRGFPRRSIQISPSRQRGISYSKVERIYALLPKMNCGLCGFPNCRACAQAIASGHAQPDACRVAGPMLAPEIEKILRES